MSHVDPPPLLRIPDKLFNDSELREYFEQQRTILFQLWNRVGGPVDAVEANEQTLTSTGSRVARNAAKINALEKIGFDVEIITTDFTTSRNQIIICNNTVSIDVTLDTDPIEEDTVHIKRSNEVVNVIGAIDGKTSIKLNVKYYSVHLVYSGVEWVII